VISRSYALVIAILILLPGSLHADLNECSTPFPPLPMSEDPANPSIDVITITADEPVVDVDVFLDLSHDYLDDVVAEITSPGGTTVRLHNQGGGSNDFLILTLDDQGVANGSVPFDSGCNVQPSGPGSLADLTGQGSLGNWSLNCFDTYPGGSTGVLNQWCLFTYDQQVSVSVLPVTSLLCTDVGSTATAQISWQNAGVYDEIQISIDGNLAASIAGTETSYTTPAANFGTTIEVCVVPVANNLAPCLGTCCVVTLQSVAADVERCSIPASVVSNTLPPTVDIITFIEDVGINDVQVQVDVSHPFVGDITIEVAHNGTTVRLHDEDGGAATSVEASYWDLGVPIGTVPVNCGCLLQPSGPGALVDFIGQSSLGPWTMTVVDVWAGAANFGTFESWCVRIYETGTVTGLNCTSASGAATAELSWQNPQPYDSINIYAGGNLEATIAGTETSYTTNSQAVPSNVDYCVEPVIASVPLPMNCCTVDFFVEPVANLLAISVAGTGEIEATWSNPFPYDEIRIYVDSNIADTISGSATSWTSGPNPVPGTAQLCIEAVQNGGTSAQECRNVPLLELADAEVCRTPGSAVNQQTSPVIDVMIVPANMLIGNIEVLVDVSHSFVGDLIVELTSSSGTLVRMHNEEGGSDEDLNVVFNANGIANALPYDCGCQMQASGPGSLIDFQNTSSIGAWLLRIDDTYPGNVGFLNRWCVRFQAGCQLLPPIGFDCSSDGENVQLNWVNSATYDDIQVLRDTVLIATISGSETEFVDVTAPPGEHQYQIEASSAAAGCSNTSLPCNAGVGITDVVFAGDEGGDIDSPAAVISALTDLGRVPMQIDQLTAAELEKTGPPQALWVCLGTYPARHELTANEGQFLAELNSGDIDLDGTTDRAPVSIFNESSDNWAYDSPTIFENYDGVENFSYGNLDDGDDSLVFLTGSDSGFGLDLVGYDAAYTQDSGGNDYTDRIIPCDVNPDLGGNQSATVWSGEDNGQVYGVAIHYLSEFAPVISQTWEFGGYGGDQTTLAQLYVDALESQGGPPPTGTEFLRGDGNDDGGVNIADAVYLLNALFVPGSPQTSCTDTQDTNDDGGVNIADAVFVLNALFVPGSPPLPDPGPSTCGVDPTDDTLDCASYLSCP